MRRVGILLAGCGVYDGSDVQETVLLVLALRRRGFRPVFLAPDIDQQDVVQHATGESLDDAAPRSVLLESARIARGTIHGLGEFSPDEIDALVIPGGLGVVKNLCIGPGRGLGGGPLRTEVAKLLDRLAARGAPVGVVGLGSVILSRHRDRGLSEEPMRVAPSAVVSEEDGRFVFTPGFMATDEITEVSEGVDRLVETLAARIGGARGFPIAREDRT